MSVDKPNQQGEQISRREQVKQAPNSVPSEKAEESFNGDPGIVDKAKNLLQRLRENKYKLLAGVFGALSVVSVSIAGYKAMPQGSNPLDVIPQGVENTQMTNAEMNREFMPETTLYDIMVENAVNKANENTPNASDTVKDTRDGQSAAIKHSVEQYNNQLIQQE